MKQPNFSQLAAKYPELFANIIDKYPATDGAIRLNWNDEKTQRVLTTVILRDAFDINIDLPSNRLCPPVPNRLSYINWLSELIGLSSQSSNQDLVGECAIPSVFLALNADGPSNLATKIHHGDELSSNVPANHLLVALPNDSFATGLRNESVTIESTFQGAGSLTRSHSSVNNITISPTKGSYNDEATIKLRRHHILDIGVGASCIYPLLGHQQQKWRFSGSDIDAESLDWAQKNVKLNSNFADFIDLFKTEKCDELQIALSSYLLEREKSLSVCKEQSMKAEVEAEAVVTALDAPDDRRRDITGKPKRSPALDPNNKNKLISQFLLLASQPPSAVSLQFPVSEDVASKNVRLHGPVRTALMMSGIRPTSVVRRLERAFVNSHSAPSDIRADKVQITKNADALIEKDLDENSQKIFTGVSGICEGRFVSEHEKWLAESPENESQCGEGLECAGGEGSLYSAVMTNPPFYDDFEEVAPSRYRACTGTEGEMRTSGGEVSFISAIIADSLILRDRVIWYTAMVGKKSSLRAILKLLRSERITNVRTTRFDPAEYYSDDEEEEEEEEGRQGDKESEEGEETNERGAHQIVQSANKKRIRTMRWGVAWSFTTHGQSVSTACREGKVLPKKNRKRKITDTTRTVTDGNTSVMHGNSSFSQGNGMKDGKNKSVLGWECAVRILYSALESTETGEERARRVGPKSFRIKSFPNAASTTATGCDDEEVNRPEALETESSQRVDGSLSSTTLLRNAELFLIPRVMSFISHAEAASSSTVNTRSVARDDGGIGTAGGIREGYRNVTTARNSSADTSSNDCGNECRYMSSCYEVIDETLSVDHYSNRKNNAAIDFSSSHSSSSSSNSNTGCISDTDINSSMNCDKFDRCSSRGTLGLVCTEGKINDLSASFTVSSEEGAVALEGSFTYHFEVSLVAPLPPCSAPDPVFSISMRRETATFRTSRTHNLIPNVQSVSTENDRERAEGGGRNRQLLGWNVGHHNETASSCKTVELFQAEILRTNRRWRRQLKKPIA